MRNFLLFCLLFVVYALYEIFMWLDSGNPFEYRLLLAAAIVLLVYLLIIMLPRIIFEIKYRDICKLLKSGDVNKAFDKLLQVNDKNKSSSLYIARKCLSYLTEDVSDENFLAVINILDKDKAQKAKSFWMVIYYIKTYNRDKAVQEFEHYKSLSVNFALRKSYKVYDNLLELVLNDNKSDFDIDKYKDIKSTYLKNLIKSKIEM